MLIDQCHLGFAYVRESEQVYATTDSVTNMLDAFAADIINEGMPESVSNAVLKLSSAINAAAKEFEKELFDGSG